MEVMSWQQALPPELAQIADLYPVVKHPGAVLVNEEGREIVKRGENYYLHEGVLPVPGVQGPTQEVVVEASSLLFERAFSLGAGAVWAVFECNTLRDAEYWKQSIIGQGNQAFRKGIFVLAEIQQRANSRLFRKGSLSAAYTTRVNHSNPSLVPDGEAQFPVDYPVDDPSDASRKEAEQEAKTRALEFFNSVVEASGVTAHSHRLDTSDMENVRLEAGFDVSGFKRIGAALDDPLFLAGVDQHGAIRARIRQILRKGTEFLSGEVSSAVAGNKTAADIRSIYHRLISDFEMDAPDHFDILAPAVLAVAHEHPYMRAHDEVSLKTWHNNVSGALGGASNVTQGKLTAKWVIIFSIVSAYHTDLTPMYTGISPERIFFWIIYGTPAMLMENARAQGEKLTASDIPYYPKAAFDDPFLRKKIYNILTRPGARLGDWEENFLQRVKHDLLVHRQK